ncbi:MAG: sporulation protein YabP [Bacilli bacterium]|nr:sporulation protein YabP [Bacilli bacterium]MDD4808928.1 sporulation protein YabP [Bacilli bacterium]
MDKTDTIASLNHNITINERKNIVVTGVNKIDSFNNEEFLMETSMGYILIKGLDLEIIKLDTYQGNVSIKGKINSLNYMEDSLKKEKEEGIFSKLFK